MDTLEELVLIVSLIAARHPHIKDIKEAKNLATLLEFITAVAKTSQAAIAMAAAGTRIARKIACLWPILTKSLSISMTMMMMTKTMIE